MKHTSYQWVLFHLDTKYYTHINQELYDKGYDNLKAFVPTLTMVKKKSKGKNIYEQVPLLFNYGFLRMPTENAFSRVFLNELKRKILGIHSFVKSTETMHKRKKKARIDNAEDFDDFSIVATVPRKEVHRFKRLAKHSTIYSSEQIDKLAIGSYIVLRGYPFEGIPASVQSIDKNNKTLTVILYPEEGKMKTKIPFENALYSIYYDYDESKLYANNLEDKSDNLTQEGLEEFLNKKSL